ncbi:MAG: hypothetical protein LC114_11490 [Bryobacterales bacterium]|nr:hypothetical protein [Bryobacterales bacterium]
MSNRNQESPERIRWLAIFGAVFLMAHFISGKAARDSLFLVNFSVEALPRMTIFAAATSILMVLLWSRRLAAKSPAALVPVALFGASVTQFALWGFYFFSPRVSSVLFYLYMIGPNAILLSSYWSLLNERFDPREAKRLFGRVAAGGTFGGLASGIVADQLAGVFGPAVLLPFQGALQFVAFLLIRQLGAPLSPGTVQPPAAPPDFAAGLRILKKNRYLLTLASLVFLVTMSANLLDYVFKAGVTEILQRGDSLVSFFALFYAFAGLVTFLMQTFVAQWFFERLGLTRSLFALPVSYILGAFSSLVIPGLGGLVALRGAESVTRGSIYRSGYEICYTPVSKPEKRATKTIVDVGADRLGEAAGGVLVQALLLAGLTGGLSGLLVVGCALSMVAGLITFRLGSLYVKTLERSLITSAREMEDPDDLPNWSVDSIVLGAGTGLAARAAVPREADTHRSKSQIHGNTPALPAHDPPSESSVPAEPPGNAVADDPLLQRIAALRSSDYNQVRQALQDHTPLGPELVPFLIPLLAWDEIADLVIRQFRKAGCSSAGQLADQLLNPKQDFSIRRRIPRILRFCPSQLSAEALIEGLRDPRFEVRFRCGKALSAITSANPHILFTQDRILGAVEREFHVSKTVWNSYRLLEQLEDAEENLDFDEVLKDRANKGLEHVFTLLSLVFPREPLQIAFKGLHATDPHLRGTALEYLESVLPRTIRERLWPFLEESPPVPGMHLGPRTREEILNDLRRSNQSIVLDLERSSREHINPGQTEPKPEGG